MGVSSVMLTKDSSTLVLRNRLCFFFFMDEMSQELGVSGQT